MITIRILKQFTAPGVPPAPSSITAEFAIRDDAVAPTWYKWSKGSIPANTADVPAFLAAIGASLYSEAVAANTADPLQYPTMAQDEVDAGAYTWQHFAYKKFFDILEYMIGDKNFNNGNLVPPSAVNPTVVTLRADLQAILSYLNTNLGGTPFERSFRNERFIAQRATASPPAFPDVVVTGTTTFLECSLYLNFIRGWVGSRINNANEAAKRLGL